MQQKTHHSCVKITHKTSHLLLVLQQELHTSSTFTHLTMNATFANFTIVIIYMCSSPKPHTHTNKLLWKFPRLLERLRNTAQTHTKHSQNKNQHTFVFKQVQSSLAYVRGGDMLNANSKSVSRHSIMDRGMHANKNNSSSHSFTK